MKTSTGGQPDDYGIFTWPNGDTYMGDWMKGIRCGKGIFRSASGKEYVGHWEGGLRHGWGVLSHANGEVYEGEFRAGRADGLGHLQSANGDTYDGQFENNKFHGMGRFCKSSDQHLGYCVRGKAEGMGASPSRAEKVQRPLPQRQARRERRVHLPQRPPLRGQLGRGWHGTSGCS